MVIFSVSDLFKLEKKISDLVTAIIHVSSSFEESPCLEELPSKIKGVLNENVNFETFQMIFSFIVWFCFRLFNRFVGFYSLKLVLPLTCLGSLETFFSVANTIPTEFSFSCCLLFDSV